MGVVTTGNSSTRGNNNGAGEAGDAPYGMPSRSSKARPSAAMKAVADNVLIVFFDFLPPLLMSTKKMDKIKFLITPLNLLYLA